MNKFEELLKEWNGGLLRGAKAKLAKALSLPHTNISNWLVARQKPSENAIKKMSKLFGISEEEIKDIFNISDGVRVHKYTTPVTRGGEDMGLIKNGEVIFFNLANVPNTQQDIEMKKEYDLKLRDTKGLPEYKNDTELTIRAVNTIDGYEGNNFVVQKGSEYYIKKLNKAAALKTGAKVIGVVIGVYRETLKQPK